MAMMRRHQRRNRSRAFFMSSACHPQTRAVLRTRARPLRIEIIEGDHRSFDFGAHPVFGCLLQYPATDGALCDYREFCSRANEEGALVAVAAELLALALLTPPGEFGADVAVGSAQRFGMPMGYGGPHPRLPGRKGRIQAPGAGPHHRRIPGCNGQQSAEDGPADPASSTSAASRRPATSAPHRFSPRWWPHSLPSTTVPRGCAP